jgi:hypothetical protein
MPLRARPGKKIYLEFKLSFLFLVFENRDRLNIRIILLLLMTIELMAQQKSMPYNEAFLWQGFKHKWSYNHRASRLGNFVEHEGKDHYAVHTSATGIGNDSTFFTTYYTKISSPKLYFKETTIKIAVYGKEGDLLHKIEEVNLPVEPWMQGKQNYRAFINGFEIRSLLMADQIQLLGFNVENPTYSAETKELKYKASLNISTNCRTVECPVLSNQTAYELTLHVLIMAYDGQDAKTVDAYFSKQYTWDQQIEVSDLGESKSIQGQSGQYTKATAGIRGLQINLDMEHWIKEIDNYITPLQYNPKSGELQLQSNQLFVEWKKGMERFAVEPRKAMFAKRGSGFAILNLFPMMIQFEEGALERKTVTGSSYWKGWNIDNDSENAVKKIKIE